MAVARPEADPQVELIRQGWSAERRPLEPRRRATELGMGGAFLAAAIALAVLADAESGLEPVRTALLVALFALAIRVNFDVGAGYTSPVQVVFVPMLLLAPTPLVPLLVAAGWLLGRLPDLRGGEVHPDRLLLVLANSWFAIGPALVLVAFDAQTPDWSDWPVYLLALLVQFAFDLAANVLREWLGQGIAPDLQLRVIAYVSGIDALLAPLGLLAAFASEAFDYAFLLLVPGAGMLVLFGRERSERLANALALADTARSRQEIVASASHELVTPLAILLGLSSRIAPGKRLDDARREQVHAAMTRELVQLRQQVRQFVDYTRLETDRELAVKPSSVAVRPVVEEVATALTGLGRLEVAVPDDLAAHADRERLHQMAFSLAAAVLNAAPGRPEVLVLGRERAGAVELVVSGAGPVVEGAFEEHGTAGLGLYVTRALAEAHGGAVAAAATAEGGSVFTLTLPRAPAE